MFSLTIVVRFYVLEYRTSSILEDKKNKPTIPISSKVYTLFQVNQTVGAFVEF